jgi:hypothetical protein
MPAPPRQLEAYKKFLEFKDHQLYIMRDKYHLHVEDCEDIFQEAIIFAIRKFDPDRGEFRNFFFTVYENRVRNFLRDNRFRIMVTSFENYENVENIEDEKIEDIDFLEYFRSMEHFSNSLKKRLNEDELEFFEELKNVIVESPRGFVSITSRNLGMEPTKGWDLWRKIVRKIKQLLEDKRAEMDRIESIRDYAYDFHPLILKDVEYSEKAAEVRENYPLLNFLSEYDIKKLLSYFE